VHFVMRPSDAATIATRRAETATKRGSVARRAIERGPATSREPPIPVGRSRSGLVATGRD
jgi:hypothetical protein